MESGHPLETSFIRITKCAQTARWDLRQIPGEVGTPVAESHHAYGRRFNHESVQLAGRAGRMGNLTEHIRDDQLMTAFLNLAVNGDEKLPDQ